MQFHPALIEGIFLPLDFTGLGKISTRKLTTEVVSRKEIKRIMVKSGTKKNPKIGYETEEIIIREYTSHIAAKKVEQIKYRITYYEDRYYQLRISTTFVCVQSPPERTVWHMIKRSNNITDAERLSARMLAASARDNITAAIDQLQNEKFFQEKHVKTTIGVIGKEKQLQKWIRGKKITTTYDEKDEDRQIY